jgi:predicted Fe-S protein YdhL (DUF1289 family)
VNKPHHSASVADETVPSPCISVCAVLESARVCSGCFRTLDEIAEWSLLDAAGKRAVLAALPARRAALGFADDAEASVDAER